MELYFVCPLTGKSYRSENWRIKGELRVVEDMEGKRRLLGMVEVECPYCGSTHACSPEDLACPLSQAGI